MLVYFISELFIWIDWYRFSVVFSWVLPLNLEGNRGENRIPLDWETRMKIAIGAAKGITRIHQENNGKFVHGNIKSSNIFLNSKNNGCVSDLGLTAVMSPLAPPISRQAGYRAPEVTDTRKSSQLSDVYSFGVVLLELLTGKSPIHTTAGKVVTITISTASLYIPV